MKFTQYYAFCALVIIYISVIKGTSNHASDPGALLRQAQHCQTLLSLPTIQSSFAERYGIVLEELGADATKKIYGIVDTTESSAELVPHTGTAQDQGMAYLDSHLHPIMQVVNTDFDVVESGAIFGENYAGFSPSSLLAEMTSWGQFESFVCISHRRGTLRC